MATCSMYNNITVADIHVEDTPLSLQNDVRLERPTISSPPPHRPYWRGGKASTPLFPSIKHLP